MGFYRGLGFADGMRDLEGVSGFYRVDGLREGVDLGVKGVYLVDHLDHLRNGLQLGANGFFLVKEVNELLARFRGHLKEAQTRDSSFYHELEERLIVVEGSEMDALDGGEIHGAMKCGMIVGSIRGATRDAPIGTIGLKGNESVISSLGETSGVKEYKAVRSVG